MVLMSFLKASLPYFEVAWAILLIITILLQQKGTGLSSAFGGSDGNIYRTKRGLEKGLFISTIVLAVLFLLFALLHLLIK